MAFDSRDLRPGAIVRRVVRGVAVLSLLTAPLVHSAELDVEGATEGNFGKFAQAFLDDHCIDCHQSDAPEGGVSLESLGDIEASNAAVWKSVWAQVSLREMPPDAPDQVDVARRLKFTDGVVAGLKSAMRGKGGFHHHLEPGKANFLDHAVLFGPLPEGVTLQPTASPARIWRVTPEEHVTRLNELINREPEYDPEYPGLRTHGDAVPTNHGGELKLYFGLDRIIKWQGGTVAYATAIKGAPSVLASPHRHGFANYADFASVNGAESTQILDLADDILRYMAEGPLSIAEPYQISDDPNAVADRDEGDIRGLPTSIVYSTEVVRPLTPVYDLMHAEGTDDVMLREAVDFLFEALTFRPPSDSESQGYVRLVKETVDQLGKQDGLVLGLSSIFLDRDALFRTELVPGGRPDRYGRVMLQDWELALAVNHALRYLKPDAELRKAVTDGRMRTVDDVRREVERILSDDRIRKPRILQFFREYFDYDLAGSICKDTKALAATGIRSPAATHYRAMFSTIASTDRLVELILSEDRDVLRELLTTDRVVASRYGGVYFGKQNTAEERAAAEARLAAKYPKEWSAVEAAENALNAFQARLEAKAERAVSKADQRELASLGRAVSQAKRAYQSATRPEFRDRNLLTVTARDLSGTKIHARVSRPTFGGQSLRSIRRLAVAPKGERMGILTHPSWLVSHSDAMDNHAISRGKWVRERLLGDGIPDVPITVDAMLPEEPDHTLRERMRVTRESECWRCHRKMDPLGLPFEMYNHAGLYRTTELDRPVDATGEIIDSGDESLDGEVADAFEMIRRLAASERVEQVFVRHAFRFWMGRNETIDDRPVLQAAHRAYRENGGSMNAMLLSLLTSDAFLYRTRD